ncbi:hypothetical protein MKW92_045342 [Papaver armeniacum]|nr:hypothetical protein MKW92_033943 [Papaver armeniacum]KAI3941066.1 hypothetical protein MKW92_045342 [Papaver armeniacum]
MVVMLNLKMEVLLLFCLAFSCIFQSNLLLINGDTDQKDAAALGLLYTNLNSPQQLTGWIANGGDPCGIGINWKGVTCTGTSVTALKLSGLQLNGNVGYNLQDLGSLKELDFSNNNLGGSIPYSLPQNLERLNLAKNNFNGAIPYSISLMASLKYLDLSHNQLQNQLGDLFNNLPELITLDVSFNALNSNLSQSLSALPSVKNIYLQNNQFTGTLDVLANLPLENLNVENNQFIGWVPAQLKGIKSLKTGGNQWFSGPAPPAPPGPPRRAKPKPKSDENGKDKSDPNGDGKKSGLGAGGIAGIIVALLVVGLAVAFFLVKKKRSKKSSTDIEKHEEDHHFTPLASNEVKEMKSMQAPSEPAKKTFETTSAAVNLRPPPIERLKSFDEEDYSTKPVVVKKANAAPISAAVYSIADLQMATASFSVDNLIGEGSIGRVYQAQFDDGKVLAVKKIDSSALPNQSSGDFLEIVSNISRLHHPNVTELVGYCSEHGQHLLIYDFYKNGSLHDFLHLSDEYSKPLTWSTRVTIALGTARALEYLHEVCSPSIIHKNFKSGNILLDTELNPHLSDCGMASFVQNADHQGLDINTGSGYSAPEVAMSGQYTLKSDVYSFGVVMLELLTGRKPFDSSRSRSEQSLVRWATPQLHDIDALDKMVDSSLKGHYPPKSLSRFADVVALCVQSEPEFRPPMSEVVQALVRLVQRANMSKRNLGEDRRSEDPDVVQDDMY